MNRDVIGVGLIGCGGMGTRLARAVRESGAGRVVGLFDAAEESRMRLADELEARACGSLDELLADDEVQAVMVATPQSYRQEPTLAAARAGKHVFVEKPMAIGTAACDRMIEAAREAGVTLMVGQALRYYEPFHSILRWTREGRFGRPFHVNIRRVWQSRPDAVGWRHKLAMCGGFLYEIGVHELDFMCCLLGRPERIYATRQKVRPGTQEMEDTVSMLVRFECGASAQYDGGTGWGETKYEMALCYEKATLLSAEALNSAALKTVSTDGKTKSDLECGETEDPVTRQVREWLECLRDGRPVPTPGEEGRAAVRMAEAAYQSAETGEVQEF